MARSKKEIKSEIPGQKLKGTFGDRCLQVLRHNKDRVVVSFLDGSNLRGVINGWGNYVIRLEVERGDVLIERHAVKCITRE